LILAIFVAISALLAGWASFWAMPFFGSSNNRASRITCIVGPLPIAIGLAEVAHLFLVSQGIDVESISDLRSKTLQALFFAFAILILAFTLLAAFIAGKIHRSASTSPHI
jgi:hypothetical protein